jgi:predicted Zn-dependent peptidase
MTCHKTVLANGLTLISVPMPHLHSTEMVCYVGVGSRHETPANAGVSHFLEHMLFRGTENFPGGHHTGITLDDPSGLKVEAMAEG